MRVMGPEQQPGGRRDGHQGVWDTGASTGPSVDTRLNPLFLMTLLWLGIHSQQVVEMFLSWSSGWGPALINMGAEFSIHCCLGELGKMLPLGWWSRRFPDLWDVLVRKGAQCGSMEPYRAVTWNFGLRCIPSKSIFWSPNPLHPRMWL